MRASRSLLGTLFVGAAWLLTAALTIPARAQDATGGLSLVYVEENINRFTEQDYVYGFINDGQGNLSPTPGSPYLTGGTGAVPGYPYIVDADHEVLINPEGTFLFAVDGFSNDVAEFSINSDGSLSSLGTFASGGVQPVALAWKDNALPGNTPVLVVANKNAYFARSGGATYSDFSVDLTTGAATPLHSFVLFDGAWPSGDVIFPNLNAFLGVNYQADRAASYKVLPTGAIVQISSSMPPGASPQVLGAAVHPTKRVLYVGLPNQNQIAIYTFDQSGNLTYDTEFANPGSGVGWLVINASGTRLYSAEPNSGTVTVYNIAAAGKPLQQQHVQLKPVYVSAPVVPTNMAFDPTGQFLYVVDSNDGSGCGLHVLHVQADGQLTEPAPPLNLGFAYSAIGVATVMK
ncbi:MAG TPA: beta-propeller fold lactonase family protein [Terriglobia bacterium]|nr:beta-propeller fold lactonase family protein [Terriglobia bacterium]